MTENNTKEMTVVCEKHGEFTGTAYYYLDEWHEPRCPKCDLEREEQQKQEKLEKEKARRAKLKMESVGISERFKKASFDGYVADTTQKKTNLAICKRFAKNKQAILDGRGLIMLGKVGTGKTHLAYAIAKQVVENFLMDVRFKTVFDMVHEIRATYSKTSELTEEEVIKKYSELDLLILDEIGMHYGSENEKVILFNILNKRYEKKNSTIIISNLALDDLKKFLSAPAVDRLKENGALLIFDWESYRKPSYDGLQ